MKKWICMLLALLLLAGSCAAADEKIQLPDSRYSLTIPDGMKYDGPGEDPDTAKFAFLSEKLGLEIDFFSYDANGWELKEMAESLKENGTDVEMYRINGIDIIVDRVTDPDDPPDQGMKCIGYVLKDQGTIVEICFWYATKKAAKLTEEIISSIEE